MEDWLSIVVCDCTFVVVAGVYNVLRLHYAGSRNQGLCWVFGSMFEEENVARLLLSRK